MSALITGKLPIDPKNKLSKISNTVCLIELFVDYYRGIWVQGQSGVLFPGDVDTNVEGSVMEVLI